MPGVRQKHERNRQTLLGFRAALARGMSALGQKQTFAVQKGLSALRPKADIHVSYEYKHRD